MKPTFFPTPADFRAWLEQHHASAPELLVGFYKKDSGRPSMDWPQSVDEALCYGWIDGVRRRIDDASYSIRFTPRRAKSIWSAVNVARVAELTRLRRMRPTGLAAFARRSDSASGTYSYEQRKTAELDAPSKRAFRANKAAWTFFEAQAASYRQAAIWWIVTAKREETRASRLFTLIDDSQHGRRLKGFIPRTGVK